MLTRAVTLVCIALAAKEAAADQRAFSLDGSAYRLNDDGSYERLDSSTGDGRIGFMITKSSPRKQECGLSMQLTNQTPYTVRYVKQCLQVFSQRGGDTVCFTFGGGHDSQSIRSGESAEASGTFDKGSCDQITGAEPYYFFSGRDPSALNVDGLAPFDARQLFSFPDAGILPVSQ